MVSGRDAACVACGRFAVASSDRLRRRAGGSDGPRTQRDHHALRVVAGWHQGLRTEPRPDAHLGRHRRRIEPDSPPHPQPEPGIAFLATPGPLTISRSENRMRKFLFLAATIIGTMLSA